MHEKNNDVAIVANIKRNAHIANLDGQIRNLKAGVTKKKRKLHSDPVNSSSRIVIKRARIYNEHEGFRMFGQDSAPIHAATYWGDRRLKKTFGEDTCLDQRRWGVCVDRKCKLTHYIGDLWSNRSACIHIGNCRNGENCGYMHDDMIRRYRDAVER